MDRVLFCSEVRQERFRFETNANERGTRADNASGAVDVCCTIMFNMCGTASVTADSSPGCKELPIDRRTLKEARVIGSACGAVISL